MSADSVAPGAQQLRFADYLHRLAQASRHLDRAARCGCIAPDRYVRGERRSAEAMAPCPAGDNVCQAHPSLQRVS